MKTFIPGKDAALEDSINYFHQQLDKYDLAVNEASWLNPVPNVWSVHIQNTQCPLCFANGKGASKKAALASALGEYFERLSTNYFFSDFYLGEKVANGEFVHYPSEKWFAIPKDNSLPKGLLSPNLMKFYDPDHELTATDLIDLQSSNGERGICALPFVQQSDGKTIYVPVNLIANLYASNGMSAGNTPNEARVQGLSEIFERYTKNKIIAEAISLPTIPAEVLNRYPAVLAAIDALEKQGFPIYCFDASLGGEFPVICVVLFNQQNGTCYASFGAHPNFGVALERTVTELLQGRSLKDLDVFSPPSFDNDDVADLSNLETHPPEDLLIANNNMAIHLRELILSLPQQKRTAKQLLAIIEQLDDEGLDDFARVRELLGIATGKDNAWLTLRIGELKAMLALAAADLPQAKLWIDWTVEMNESIFTPERNHAYRCLQTLVNFIIERGENQFSDYQKAFNKMYGKDCVDDMWQYATAKKQFFGLIESKDAQYDNNPIEQFAMHQKLLAVYHKLQQTM